MSQKREWHELLKNCDLHATANEIKQVLYVWKEEAELKGVGVFFKREFLYDFYHFLDSPWFST